MRDHVPPQSAKHRVERPVLGPCIENVPHRFPRSELRRHIPPGGASAQHPQHCVEKLTTVSRSTSSLEAVRRKQILDQLPLLVGEAMPGNAGYRHGPFDHKSAPPPRNWPLQETARSLEHVAHPAAEALHSSTARRFARGPAMGRIRCQRLMSRPVQDEPTPVANFGSPIMLAKPPWASVT